MKTIEELVTDALVPVKEYLTNTPPIVPEDWEDSPKTRYFGEENDVDNAVRLRFDYELTAESEAPYWDTEYIARLMTEQLKGDIVDIIDNGDKISSDPSLKSMNGAKLLGLTPRLVTIEELVHYREYMPKKKAHEYTVFMLLNVEWDTNEIN